MDLSSIDGITLDSTNGNEDALEVVETNQSSTTNKQVVGPVAITRDNFRTFTECIGMMPWLPCNDCDIRQGIVRQQDNYRNTIVELDLTNIIDKKSLAISNAKEKHSVMRALDVDDSVDWANEDLTLNEDDKFYEIIDKESTVRFRKPAGDLMSNSFIDEDALASKVDESEDKMIFSVDIKPFMVKRVKGICESMGTDFITVSLKDEKGSISVKARNTSEELNANVMSEFDLDKKVPECEFTIGALPFKINSGAELNFKFYKQKRDFLMVFEQMLFGSIKFRILGLVRVQQ